MKFALVFFLSSSTFFSCTAQKKSGKAKVQDQVQIQAEKPMLLFKVGAEMLNQDLSMLQGKRIALVVNPTSMVGPEHLVDVLLSKGIQIVKVLAPEHGFRGKADAGEEVQDNVDAKTGLSIVSLYGNHRKPTAEDLVDLDLVVFDIQDVGARFYTYISTLHYVMEACGEYGVKVLVLDRPNPNGDIVDGNVLDMAHKSFVGMHPIPILHGMTIGEYALMINGEKWLANGLQCDLKVVKCQAYNHNMPYSLPVKPSPNLPDDRAIKLYPSTCFFEGTVISEGRGTDIPFQVFGAPEIDPKLSTFSFVPKSKEGAKFPKFENKTCYGFNISKIQNDFEEQKGINLDYLITMYNLYPSKDDFFLKNEFFDLLAGGTALRAAIVNELSAAEIKASWESDLNEFKKIRDKYLLYKDFE
jgi:uncharacterized protein YbbC (DUF1343 family)